jgi:signal transduction histidine kinase
VGKQTIQSDRFKIGLSLFWFVFTFSMVTWWWIFSLQQLDSPDFVLPPEKMHKLRRMLLWEGSFLLAFIFSGGASLLILTNRERLRNLRLRMFFSNFSHDLKTSLSRLRLRAEVLIENDKNPRLHKLMEEVNRLDLQLENSLWVARGEEQKLLTQEFSLGELLSQLRVEWPELEVHLQQDAILRADRQAVQSIFRNLFQNAWLHGKASKIDIQVQASSSQTLTLIFSDNGSGFSGSLPALGKEMLPSKETSGNGIGLYLTKFLLGRMNGQIQFETLQKGFRVLIKIPGKTEAVS